MIRSNFLGSPQEVCSLGLTGVSLECKSGGLSAVPVLNLLYEVLQLQRRAQRALHELESQQLKNGSDLEHLQHSNCRLKVLRFLLTPDNNNK